MNAVGASLLAIFITAVLLAPKPWALLAVTAGMLFITEGQQLQVFGFHLWAARIIEIAGLIRVMFRKELSFAHLSGIDRAFMLVYGFTATVFVLRSSEGRADQIGIAVDAFLCYFICRSLVANLDDFKKYLRLLPFLLLPFVVLLLIESFTRANPFLSMGGFLLEGEDHVDLESWSRNGRLRCFGSFRHPSLLGTVGGSFLPLFIGLWLDKEDRGVATLGIGLCLAIVWASNSGGPMSCLAAAAIGWALWRVRTKMNLVRRGLVALLIFCGIFMKSPIWYLIAKVSDLVGGDGYHRAYLLDVAFQNLGQWWLFGMSRSDTAGWFPYTNGATGAADITDQFLKFGITAGLSAMVLFIVLLKRAFSDLGRALAVIRSGGAALRKTEFIYWGLAVMLVVHVQNWLGISYFDQSYILWFTHLAFIATLTQTAVGFSHTKTTETPKVAIGGPLAVTSASGIKILQTRVNSIRTSMFRKLLTPNADQFIQESL